MLAYIRDQYLKAQQKLEAVRAQTLLGIDDGIGLPLTPKEQTAVDWQLKPHEISVGLWHGRLLEAQAVADLFENKTEDQIVAEVMEIIHA